MHDEDVKAGIERAIRELETAKDKLIKISVDDLDAGEFLEIALDRMRDAVQMLWNLRDQMESPETPWRASEQNRQPYP